MHDKYKLAAANSCISHGIFEQLLVIVAFQEEEKYVLLVDTSNGSVD